MPTYLTHDNGSRPFKVVLKNNNVTVLKQDKNETYTIEVFKSKYSMHFIPKNDYFEGDSVLIKINRKKYVYIGECIYEFIIDDEIIKFYSPNVNSDVPYPYAIGIKNTYLMLDHVYARHVEPIGATRVYIPNFLSSSIDPYQQYYGYAQFPVKFTKKTNILINNYIKNNAQKFFDDNFKFKVKMIHKRII